MTTFEAVIMVAIFSVTTFATRVLAFVVFPHRQQSPKFLDYLGKVLPCAITALLVVYCLRNTHIVVPPHGLPVAPELLAVLLTAGVYLCLKKFDCGMLAAIAAGTAAYMFMVQVLFAAV